MLRKSELGAAVGAGPGLGGSDGEGGAGARHEGPVLPAGAAARAVLANKEGEGAAYRKLLPWGARVAAAPKGRRFCLPRCWEGKSLLLKKLQCRSLKSQGVAEGAGMVNHVLLHEWVQSHYKGLVENKLL